LPRKYKFKNLKVKRKNKRERKNYITFWTKEGEERHSKNIIKNTKYIADKNTG
jgi:hypothetical protein